MGLESIDKISHQYKIYVNEGLDYEYNVISGEIFSFGVAGDDYVRDLNGFASKVAYKK